MQKDLAEKKCIPCCSDIPPLEGQALQAIYKKLGNNWKVVHEHHIEKEFAFKNFREALEFTVKVGKLAEAEGHHPDIYLVWGKVKLTVWTHKVDGLTENDFIFAAKADRLFS